MSDTGYDLAGVKVRYFFSSPSLPRLLKSVRRFVKDNESTVVDSINFDSRYCDEEESVVWEARITYLGVAN